MAQILTENKAPAIIKEIKISGKTIVLVGGCFDILHPGHIIFLEKAKKEGDILVVLLESDARISQLKGKGRPVHNQKDRAEVLSAVSFADYIIMLPFFQQDVEYDRFISKIKPDIIAASFGDILTHHKKRAAKLTGAQLKFVTKIIGSYSSSKILGAKLK